METRLMAEFISGLKYSNLPPATKEMARKCILDWLGCCIRGSIEAPAKIMRRTVLGRGGGKATVFAPKPLRTSAFNSALVNGAASHALDMDDLHNASIIHLGVVVVPAALAVAEAYDLSGQELFTAVVAGYEVGARVGEAVNPDSYFFWHTTGTAGTIGAAAAVAKLLNLDADAVVNCLGTAGTQAAGLWEFLKDGAMSKTLHAGKAAANGVLAGLLAQEGFTAAQRILEGEKGFCRAMTANPKLSSVTASLGQRFKIDENSFKPYAACKHCHPAMNAAQVLVKEKNIDYRDISSITVKTNSVAENLVNNPNPENEYGCKFSIQYCTAAALRFSDLGPSAFTKDNAIDPETLRLMKIISVEVDPEFDAEYRRDPQKWSALVRVILKDNKVVEQFIPYPKGDPQNPMSYEEAEAKFRSLTEVVYSSKMVKRLADSIRNLETFPSVKLAFSFLHK